MPFAAWWRHERAARQRRPAGLQRRALRARGDRERARAAGDARAVVDEGSSSRTGVSATKGPAAPVAAEGAGGGGGAQLAGGGGGGWRGEFVLRDGGCVAAGEFHLVRQAAVFAASC